MYKGNKLRAGVIIYARKERAIVLIERIKPSKHYMVIPGEDVEYRETSRDVAVRKIKTILGIKRINANDVEVAFQDGNDSYFWYSIPKAGPLFLSKREWKANCLDDQYIIRWIAVKDIRKKNVIPFHVKSQLIQYLQFKKIL